MTKDVFAGQVSESKLRELLTCKFESDDLDFKETFDPTSKKDRLELCKDIIAMANTRGGHIVLGVHDIDFTPIGLSHSNYMDAADLNNTLQNYVHEHIEWYLAFHEINISGQHRLFGIIYVVPASVPIVTAKTGAYQDGDRSKTAFGEAAWLVRSGARSMPASPSDVRRLLQERQRPTAPISPAVQAFPPDYQPPVIHNLPRPNFLNFVGREAEIREVFETLDHERAWVISIEGIGGVGKTALAQKVALDLVGRAFQTGQTKWQFIIWMSAKETVLEYDDHIETVTPGFQNLDELLDIVLSVTGLRTDAVTDHESKLKAVKEILSTFPCLLIIDNLETVADEAVERFVVDQLPPPSKAIVTSRQRTARKGGLTILLKGMETEKAIQMLQEAAQHQGSSVIKSAPRSKLKEIVELTGGIPLALKLVVGQTALGVNLDVVIDRLMHNQSAPILEFCFEETYKDLALESRKLLIAISLFEGPATLEEIIMVAHELYGQASRHIEPLVRLSLVDETFDDVREAQTYSMLPLTKLFVEKQAKEVNEFYQAAKQRLAIYRLRKQQVQINDISPDAIKEAKARTELERLAVSLAIQAETEYSSRHYKQAIDFLREAETLAPRLSYVQQKWAYIERRENHISPARERYRQAVEFDRTNGENYRFWASLETQVGQYEEAARLFREAVLLNALDVRAKHGLANVLLRSAAQLKLKRKAGHHNAARSMLLEALQVIEDAFSSQPEQAKGALRFWETKARILSELGRPKQALETCEAGLKIGYDATLSSLAAELKRELSK